MTFDHLEDPDPPVPGVDARAGVHGRARTLQLRRRVVIGGSSTAALSVVLVVAMAIASSGSPGRSSSVRYVTEPPAVELASPTPTPSATPSPTPSPTPSEAPSPTSQPTVTPTASPACDGFPGDCPDGTPGWGTGFTSCAEANVAERPATTDVAEGLTASLVVDGPVAAGSRLHGVVTLTNRTDQRLTVHYTSTFTRLEVDGAASYGTDALGTTGLVLEPHDSRQVAVEGPTVQCADTSRDDEPALAPGTYRTQLVMPISDVLADAPEASASPTALVPLASDSPMPEPSPSRYAGTTTLQLGAQVTLT